jgi:hypothetical protein
MSRSNSLALAILVTTLAAALPAADAFVAPRTTSSQIPRQVMMMTIPSSSNGENCGAGAFGAVGLVAAVLASGGSSAVAAMAMADGVPPAPPAIVRVDSTAVSSSTIQLSETIKTMEFSLPSSYDSISDAKSAATDELTVTVNPPVGGGKRAPKAKSGVSGGGSKQPAMTSEERAALQAARQAAKEAEAAAKAAARAADKEAAEQAAAAKREAQTAVREAEKAAKAAEAKLKKEAAAEKEAQKAAAVSSNVEFVDMGLPSYGDSAKTEGKKSAFAL